ncbi:hypothetical protein [Lysinibacillus piscis]|uniref:Regulatory protein YycH-like domain-containing protein n=1 Tax=Lysinibacillus piscis TaxID=2518931 RepID=A0ABQ5NN02_9BACI|nr:hypothetical protein [Lysinibacillus sp. KH24]GLC89466.1 hypothetical protein LYSBPC_25930 [Lysinibacillus sp. KH24]
MSLRKKHLSWLILLTLLLLVLLLIRNEYLSSHTAEEDKPINKYNEFNSDVLMLKEKLSPEGFDKITTGESLNRSLTSFPDYQTLDIRNHDGVDNDSSRPSRYEIFYLSKDETILVRLNLIYAPEFTNTKIVSLQSFSPGRIEFVDTEYQNIVSISSTSYLISYKNGLAQVDFWTTNKFPSSEDDYFHLLNEGEEKFLPTLQDILLKISNEKK